MIPAVAAIPLPPEIDFDTGASFLVTYLTAHHLLHTMGRVKSGGVVLLYAAAGGVGTATIQLAKIAGIEIIGLTSSDEKVQRLRDLGLEHVFTYDRPDLVEEVRKVTGGRGVDAILDSVAGTQFHRNFDMLAPLGQLVWFGYSGGMPPEDLLEHLGAHFIKGIGLHTFHLTYSVAEPYPELAAHSVGVLLEHLVAERIEPIIHDRFPLTEAHRAHELLENRATVGKLILNP
ncbi:MAG: zinc-binding dehydrogenase [Acidobacteria bacterium]|nr:zinc-binding dehydrogenase [Acidobacteriota bacterium]